MRVLVPWYLSKCFCASQSKGSLFSKRLKNQSKVKKCTFVLSRFFPALLLKKWLLQSTGQRLDRCASIIVMILGSWGNRWEKSRAIVKLPWREREQNGLLVPVLRMFMYLMSITVQFNSLQPSAIHARLYHAPSSCMFPSSFVTQHIWLHNNKAYRWWLIPAHLSVRCICNMSNVSSAQLCLKDLGFHLLGY